MVPSIYEERIQFFENILEFNNESVSGWFQNLEQNVKLGKFNEMCCRKCKDQRIIDLFVFKFRQIEQF